MSKILMCCLLIGFLIGCKKPYAPPEITAANNFLVVEGVINTNPASQTTITLTRSRKLTDTIISLPEGNAQVLIEDNNGIGYYLSQTSSGIYKSGPLTLNPSMLYRLKITTLNGQQYVSDFVPVKNTPVIDSLSWDKQTDVTVYLDTHDQQKVTRFYRWEFAETWEFHPFFDSNLGFKDGQLYFRDSSNQINKCWSGLNSTDILVASTLKLSEDIISHFPIVVIPAHSEKLRVKYSVLVKQYSLTLQAFDYWELLKKNTEQLGTLFDAQPSQLTGNIHNIKDPAEPVIGFLSACAIQEKRIFIQHYEVAPWEGPDYDPSGYCTLLIINPGEAADYLTNSTTLAPAFHVTGGGLAISKVSCVDCRLHGGTTTKPAFWQ